MRKYLKRMEGERSTHERRRFALYAAGAVTAVLFVTWAGSLGVRLADPGAANPSVSGAGSTQSAAVANYQGQQNNLEVATTSIFGN